jgi:hypothetical protein
MSSKEISKLFEEVDQVLTENVSHSLIVMNEDKIAYQTEISQKIDNPYEFDVSAFLPNSQNMSLDRFYSLAKDLIEDAQKRAGILEEKRVSLVEEYPPERLDKLGNEVICFRLLKREPANMDTKASSRPHRKSTYYYDYNSPLAPNKSIIVESRPVDHRIEFTCWGKSNKICNKRAIWLEKLFINHSWVFEVQGVERFYWLDRGPDTYMMSGNQRLFYRPINFFVRFREFEIKSNPIIQNIKINIKNG